MLTTTEPRIWAGLKGGRGIKPPPYIPVVYLLMDRGGNVLYVGMTSHAANRLRAHRAPQSRTAEHVMWMAEECADQEAAVRREAELITRYQPPLNVAGL